MKTIRLGRKFAVLISILILTSFAMGSLLTQMYFPQLGKISGQLEDPLEAWSETSYITWQYNSTFYACRNMSTNIVDYFGASDDAAIQWGINKCTTHGGSVYVKAPTYTGTYSASVTLKDNVTLYIEKGAIGITVSFDAGADCTLVDEQNGFRKEYVAGVLYSFMDYRTGEFWWDSQNRTDTLLYPESEASYIVFQDGSLTKMKNGTTGQIDFQSTNTSAIYKNAIGNLTVGGEIYTKAGTYNLNGTIIGYEGTDDVTLSFENGAILFVSDGMNAPAIKTFSVNNWLIEGVTIDGNMLNQAHSPAQSNTSDQYHGIQIRGGSNNLINRVNVTQCGLYGIDLYADSDELSYRNGVTNSLVTYCGWNCITVDSGIYNFASYVINNEVSHAGDVGIAAFARSTLIQDNYVHDIDGSLGEQNSQWGIACESGGDHNIVTGNTITTCNHAIDLHDCDYNTVALNDIRNVKFGIYITSNFNIVQTNKIIDYDSAVTNAQAIIATDCSGNQIKDNYVESDLETARGIFVGTCLDTKVSGNTINVNKTASYWVIDIYNSNRTDVRDNQITGYYGVLVNDAGSINTNIFANSFNVTSTAIGDSGTDSIIHCNIVNGAYTA